ncbi:MAG: hypothetical protein ABFD46_07065, partial [Armatimonadota bacterium]
AGALMDALEKASLWWNNNPTPFIWGGKRQERRRRAKERRHAVGGSGACTIRPLHSVQTLRKTT